MIRFTCHKCQAVMETDDQFAGQTASCNTCNEPLVIPSLQSDVQPQAPLVPSPPGERPLDFDEPAPRRPRGRRRRYADDYDDYDDYDDDYDYRPRRRRYYGPRPQSRGEGAAIASMVLGILGVVLIFCVWFIGLPLCLIGLVLGLVGINSEARGMAVAGLTLSLIGLVLAAALFFTLMNHPVFRGGPGRMWWWWGW